MKRTLPGQPWPRIFLYSLPILTATWLAPTWLTPAWAAPPKVPEPPTWQGPATLSVWGIKPEDALVRARLAAPAQATGLRVQVRALDAEQPLGSFTQPLDQPLRLRGLPAGTWAIEAATVAGAQSSRWSDPLVIEVQALGDGVLTVPQGAEPGLAVGAPCTVDGQPFLHPAPGDHSVTCGGQPARVQVVPITATWSGPAPRGTPINAQITLSPGPLPALVDLVVGGQAWPLRVTPRGLEGRVILPAGLERATLRDPDVPSGPPLAEVALPAAPGGAQ